LKLISYPEYRESGLPWLGDIPKHWQLIRMKTILRERTQKGFSEEPLLAATQTKGVVRKEQFENRTVLALKDLHLLKLVRVGDFVISLRSFQGGIEYAREQGIISPAYTILYPTDPDAHGFLKWLFKSKPYIENLSLYVTGIRQGQNIDYEKLSRSILPFPPQDEQESIDRYLKFMDRRIRRYIRDKQRLIKLLEEQKQAIIHRAVTRGLDPNVRLKDSGIEWLGDIPGHWTLKRFKFVGRITSGQIDPRENEHAKKILIAPNHIISSTGRIAELVTAKEQGADSGKYLVRQGQIIYSKIRPNLRKAAIAPIDCLCSADMYPITVSETELRTKYFLLLLLSEPFTKYAIDCSLRVAMPKVNREALGECWIWYPGLEEQDAILEFVDQISGPANRAIDQAFREITLLREYRTRLISDVVTGKLDVQKAAAHIPEEIEESERINEVNDLTETENESDIDIEELSEEADG